MDDGLKALMGIDDDWERAQAPDHLSENEPKHDEISIQIGEDTSENKDAIFRPAAGTLELENSLPKDDMLLDPAMEEEEEDNDADIRSDEHPISLVADMTESQSDNAPSPPTSDSSKNLNGTNLHGRLRGLVQPARSPSPHADCSNAPSITSSPSSWTLTIPDDRKIVGRMRLRDEIAQPRVDQQTEKRPNNGPSSHQDISADGVMGSDSDRDSQTTSTQTKAKERPRRRPDPSRWATIAEARRAERLRKMFDTFSHDYNDDSDDERLVRNRSKKTTLSKQQSKVNATVPTSEGEIMLVMKDTLPLSVKKKANLEFTVGDPSKGENLISDDADESCKRRKSGSKVRDVGELRI